MIDRPDIDCFADTTIPPSTKVFAWCAVAALMIVSGAAFLCAISAICKGE